MLVFFTAAVALLFHGTSAFSEHALKIKKLADFKIAQRINRGHILKTRLDAGPRAIHSSFTVERATPEQLKELDVKSWGRWSTAGSSKYKVGVKSPLKVYDCNELSFIISGKVEITPQATGVPILVQAGDFVTFPDGFPCYWYVIEEITKSYYIY